MLALLCELALLHPQLITVGEGQTLLQQTDFVGDYVGMDHGRLHLQYEGMNPSGSFKDNGMCAADTHANMMDAKRAACASTGNTSASLALYCSATVATDHNYPCASRHVLCFYVGINLLRAI